MSYDDTESNTEPIDDESMSTDESGDFDDDDSTLDFDNKEFTC